MSSQLSALTARSLYVSLLRFYMVFIDVFDTVVLAFLNEANHFLLWPFHFLRLQHKRTEAGLQEAWALRQFSGSGLAGKAKYENLIARRNSYNTVMLFFIEKIYHVS